MTVGANRAHQILDAARGKRIAVVGDFMLDRHLYGSVRRISPEAPVPVVEIEDERSALGGAGNVVQNLAALGAIPIAFGVVGDDPAGKILSKLLDDSGCGLAGMITATGRRTSEKTRIIAHDQHVVRADRESTDLLSHSDEDKLIIALRSIVKSLDALICQDYNKGVLTDRVIGEVVELCAASALPVSVDPKFDHFWSYRGCSLFKPNVRELESALGRRLREEQDLTEAANAVFEKLQPRRVLITRGEKGMALYSNDGSIDRIPTRAKQVHDVSGAGDTVIATFVTAECGGANAREAAELANLAAGLVCEEVGVVPIRRERLLELSGKE